MAKSAVFLEVSQALTGGNGIIIASAKPPKAAWQMQSAHSLDLVLTKRG
jgi:hypothetical protein